jgi:hypothetical protein
MKIKTTLAAVVLLGITLAARATSLFSDNLNYPNGCIETDGFWYCYYPPTPYRDALVTNNVLLLNATNHDAVAAPTNGWVNPTEFNFASFSINVSQLPNSPNGGYFCQFQDINDTNDCCHVFIDTRDTVVPGTYRLGVANYDNSFGTVVPPVNYPMDLATGVTYTVVILFDTNQSDLTFVGSTLWINPSEEDYQNVVDGYNTSPGIGEGFVYGTDTTTKSNLLNINISQIGFSQYGGVQAIGNIKVGTNFDDVNTTNLPVFGIQPQSATNYSGNSATFYAVASGVDVTYQWYSTTSGLLQDNGNIIGTTSNILVINNLSASDNYYCVATDAYGNTATSSTAANTVITTPTAPFFTETPLNLTNNLFTTASFTDPAGGTGPLYYQWYFAPTNTPNTYSPLAGQTSSTLVLNLSDYSFAGNYYVVASNSINGGSIAYGPTNSITELAPILATIEQLHNLMIASSNQVAAYKSSYFYINTNNVTVGGYVTTYGGFGNPNYPYCEYFIQDSSGYGIEVYLANTPTTNTPPVGTYVTVSGPVEVYHTELEIAPASLAAVTPAAAPVVALSPRLANSYFSDLTTNYLGTNALLSSCSLVTFTNVYIYGKGGGALNNGGLFYSNSYTIDYFTVGQYGVPASNTNLMEIYQFGYDYGTNANQLNPFDNQSVPTNCTQLTGVYVNYGGTAEIEPSRLADYVTNPPAPFAARVTQTKGVPTITWSVQAGSTYSVYSKTNLSGPWAQTAYGLAYYPTNGAFTDTNSAKAKFYRISTP